jgi:hypothetical protein
VDKDLAMRLLELTGESTGALTSIAEEVKRVAPGRGAQLFESGVLDVWGKLIMAFMSPAWDQYPELRSEPEIPPEEAYDPDWFNLPKELVIKASWSLSRVQQMVTRTRSVVDASDVPAVERERFLRFLAEIEAELQFQKDMLREQHPDFRGSPPKEAIPEPSYDEMQSTGPQATKPRR